MSLLRLGDCDVFIVQPGYHLKTEQGKEKNKGGEDTTQHVCYLLENI